MDDDIREAALVKVDERGIERDGSRSRVATAPPRCHLAYSDLAACAANDLLAVGEHFVDLCHELGSEPPIKGIVTRSCILCSVRSHGDYELTIACLKVVLRASHRA